MLNPKDKSRVSEKMRELMKGKFYGPRELMIKHRFEEELKRRREEAQNENNVEDLKRED